MGNFCENNEVHKLEIIQRQNNNSESQSYEKSFWPANIQQKINNLKSHSQLNYLFQTAQIMKQKNTNKYYLGEWFEGRKKGKGILLDCTNYLYYGDIDNGVPHGFGTLEKAEQKYTLVGEFKNGQPAGEVKIKSQLEQFQYEGTLEGSTPKTGILVLNKNGVSSTKCTIRFNNYPQNSASIIYEDGRQYEGLLHNIYFQPEGEGVARFPDGSSYLGQWHNGLMHGKGIFTWNNGSQYEGEYYEGKKHGNGKFIYPSKKVYQGMWASSKQNGEGILFDQSGTIVKKGRWKEGVYIGKMDYEKQSVD